MFFSSYSPTIINLLHFNGFNALLDEMIKNDLMETEKSLLLKVKYLKFRGHIIMKEDFVNLTFIGHNVSAISRETDETASNLHNESKCFKR